jgi:hypothetical protein
MESDIERKREGNWCQRQNNVFTHYIYSGKAKVVPNSKSAEMYDYSEKYISQAREGRRIHDMAREDLLKTIGQQRKKTRTHEGREQQQKTRERKER